MPQQIPIKVFDINNEATFINEMRATFLFQQENNPVYNKWCSLYKPGIAPNLSYSNIPFLPISFFKHVEVTSTNFTPQAIFESSGTTTSVNSKHLVKDLSIYESSFTKTFEIFYGDIADWCIIGLLPSYLERNNSSLVYMVNSLIEQNTHYLSGFYLNDFSKLAVTLQKLELSKQPTLLIGVTFALLDFAELYPINLNHTIVMETGGMKGRREELTRNEVHAILKKQFGISQVHSEYGMTELLSQAYSNGNGRFTCPPWMKVLVRAEDDPLQISLVGKGILNIIDLANIYSCSFIATDDVGIVYEDGSFEVLGRLDNSDIRGCSLMVV
jgi:Acyl-protein synthetase, LuxE